MNPVPESFGRGSTVRSSDGCSIAYWDGGNAAGPPLVFLHGFAVDHAVWGLQWADPNLSSKYRLVAVDLRGHGVSGHPSQEHRYTDGRLWAEDLKAVIEACNLHQPVVVAWSYGGRMVNDYLRHFGSRDLGGINYIAAATVADPDCIGPDHSLLTGMCSSDPETEIESVHRFVSVICGQSPASPMAGRFREMISQTTPLTRTWLRRRALDYETVLAQITVPTLISHGTDDLTVLPSLAFTLEKALSCSIPKVSMYEHAGHAVFLNCPGRFNRELDEFAQRCSASEHHCPSATWMSPGTPGTPGKSC